MLDANVDLLLKGAGDLVEDGGKAKILNAFLASVFTDKTDLQEYWVHYCLTSSLMTWTMGESASCAALQFIQDWEECWVVLSFKGTLRETGWQKSHEDQQREEQSAAPEDG